jgi:tryptophanyl-tRNA synthetase
LHLGHYFSVIRPGQQGVEVLVANYHAPEERNLEEILSLLQKFGVKNIKLQKDVFNAEFYFQLLSISSIGDLERMTQYKSSTRKTGQLLTYPVLMAHDVAGYDEVLVGLDQKQHLEYAGRLLRKYNHHFQEVKIPVTNIVAGRVKDLRHPEKKMSKSSPEGCLFLTDSPEVIRDKLRRATMDEVGRENLEFLYRDLVGESIPEGNQQLKEELAEGIIGLIG